MQGKRSLTCALICTPAASTDQVPTAAEAVRPGMGPVATGCTGKWEVRSLAASTCRGNNSWAWANAARHPF